MLQQLQYKNEEERLALLQDNLDKYLLEERNIEEGNFLVFSDVPNWFLELRETTATQKYNSLNKENTPLEKLKSARLEKLKEEYSEAASKGFTSNGNQFSFNEQDQANFTQQLVLIVAGQTTDVQWKTQNAGVQIFTTVEFQEIISDAADHKLVQQNKYWDREVLILAAETNEEVDSVIWE